MSNFSRHLHAFQEKVNISLGPVSYTHLDVYKRQVHGHSERDRGQLVCDFGVSGHEPLPLCGNIFCCLKRMAFGKSNDEHRRAGHELGRLELNTVSVGNSDGFDHWQILRACFPSSHFGGCAELGVKRSRERFMRSMPSLQGKIEYVWRACRQ